MEYQQQFKRKPQGLWAWRERIYIPCPLRLKNQFAEQARKRGISQAELGTLIVECAMENDLWLTIAVMQGSAE